MHRDPTPSEKVRELLRTYNEALHDTAPWTSGGGVRMMPGTYSLYSYPELEHRMRQMATSMKQEWWHTSARYWWGNERWLKVPYRRTTKGPVPILPSRCEERIQGEVIRIEFGAQVQHAMQVKCYVWSDAVDEKLVVRGIERLVTTMYDGDTTRLSLPEPFLWRMLGIEKDTARVTV
jgi:hypothetical protein